MTIPQQAIEAGARASAIARRGVTAHVKDLDRQAAQATLTAALPALEQQIREQVARELAEEATRLEQTKHLHDQDQTLADALILGVRHSAKLARGKDQA